RLEGPARQRVMRGDVPRAQVHHALGDREPVVAGLAGERTEFDAPALGRLGDQGATSTERTTEEWNQGAPHRDEVDCHGGRETGRRGDASRAPRRAPTRSPGSATRAPSPRG